MMSARKKYTKTLDKFGNERLRIKLTIIKGKVADLVFQYKSFINDRWREVVRYDVAHGFFHRDFILPNGSKERAELK